MGKDVPSTPITLTNKAIMSKVAAACKNHSIPEQFYENITICANLDRLSQEVFSAENCEVLAAKPHKKVGLSIKRDVVMHTKYGSLFQGQLIHGDILLSVNNHILTDDQIMVKTCFGRAVTIGGKVTVRVARLKRYCPLKCSLPQGFKAEEGAKYEWAMLYLVKGMHLGLSVKEIDGMLYVAQLLPDGLACMGFSVGERIIDIDGQLVTDIQTTVDKMRELMDKNGMIRICVESPTNDLQRNIIRNKITTAMMTDEPLDNAPADETQTFAEKGIRAIKTFKGELKSIVKEKTSSGSNSGSTKPKPKFNEKTVETGILIEVQSKLLVTVPPAKTVDSEAAVAGSAKNKEEKK